MAIVFINSHANAAHELRGARSSCASYGFTGPVSLSHQTTGQYREYERTSTTVIDAYVRPAVAGYLERLESGLREDAVDGECLITTSAGGCIAFEEARIAPVRDGHVRPGGRRGRRQHPVPHARPGSRDHRRRRRHQLRHLPARRRPADRQVRGRGRRACRCRPPGSTSARSGPAAARSPISTTGCSASGRAAPAPSRARSPTAAAAPSRPSPTPPSRSGMFARTTLASGLELDIEGARELARAAWPTSSTSRSRASPQGVIRIAAATMAGAMRAVSIEVGQDPRDGALIAYGGAGPLFGSLLARELQIRTLVIPNYAGQLLRLGAARAGHGPLGRAARSSSRWTPTGIAAAERTLARLFAQLDRAGGEPGGRGRRRSRPSSTCATRARSTRWPCRSRSPTEGHRSRPSRSPAFRAPPTSATTATRSRSA